MTVESLVLSARQTAAIDGETQTRFGIDAAVLMENAGRGVWEYIRVTDDDGPIVCVAGPGHNGGDALVVARHAYLSGAFEVVVVTVREDLKPLTATQWSALESLGLSRFVWESDREAVENVLASASLVVDGISGTGLTGALRAPADSLVAAINGAGIPVVAIDVPSGARAGAGVADPLVRARATVVTGSRKDFLYCARVRHAAGEITTVDPGFPPTLIEEVAARAPLVRMAARRRIKKITPDDHKGRRGRLLVVGGSAGAAGAAILAAEAAFHGGAGMVRILSEPATVAAALVREPAILGDPLPEADQAEEWSAVLDWADALVVGPGWIAAEPADLAALLHRAEERSLAVVIDAAALRLLSKQATPFSPEWVRDRVVLTPHPGEMAALLAGYRLNDTLASDPFTALRRFREHLPATVVLKDSVTIVAGEECVVVDGREPALGTAGSGDVLAGVIGALLARGVTAMVASEGGVLIHLEAGRRLAREEGWFTASRLATAVGRECYEGDDDL